MKILLVNPPLLDLSKYGMEGFTIDEVSDDGKAKLKAFRDDLWKEILEPVRSWSACRTIRTLLKIITIR